MPNYGLMINSKFKPFSYQEMLAPVLMATQAHQQIENEYGELDAKASVWENMASKENDPRAYAQYKRYADDLRAQADALAAEGLNSSSRQSMLNLRSRYAKEILPIEQAYQRRAAQIDAQTKAGNQMINSYDASTLSLDEYLDNPALSYSSINRADLLKEATALMGQFANELREFKLSGSGDKFYKKLTENYGLTKEEAMNFANTIARGQIDDNNAIMTLAQHIYNTTGVANWNNADASDRVWETIAEAVTAGIGKQSAKLIEDKEQVIAQQQQYAKELANYKANQAGAARNAALVANVGFRNNYDIEKDETVPALIKLGLLKEDRNGRLTYDKKALEEYLDGGATSEKVRQLGQRAAQLQQYGGQPVPSIIHAGMPDVYIKEFSQILGRNLSVGDRLSNEDRVKIHNARTNEKLMIQDYLDANKNIPNLETALEKLSEASGMPITISNNNGNYDFSQLDNALSVIGDKGTLNQGIYFKIDETNSKDFATAIKSANPDISTLVIKGADGTNKDKVIDDITSLDLESAIGHNIIVKKDKNGNSKAYYEATLTTGDHKGESVAIQLPEEVSSSIVNAAEGINRVKQSEISLRTKRRKQGAEYGKEFSDLEEQYFYNQLNTALLQFANSVAYFGRTNKVEEDKYKGYQFE